MEAFDPAALPWDVALLAVLLVANRTLARQLTHPAVFFPLEALLLGGAAWFASQGIQGLQAYPVARWVVAALLVFHAIQNWMIRLGSARKL